MPIYVFKDINTGEIIEKTLKISELEDFKRNNPHLIRFFKETPAIGDPIRLGIRKPDAGWREVLQKIADTTPGGEKLREHIR